jgi:uncharacterized integral membrane protein
MSNNYSDLSTRELEDLLERSNQQGLSVTTEAEEIETILEYRKNRAPVHFKARGWIAALASSALLSLSACASAVSYNYEGARHTLWLAVVVVGAWTVGNVLEMVAETAKRKLASMRAARKLASIRAAQNTQNDALADARKLD